MSLFTIFSFLFLFLQAARRSGGGSGAGALVGGLIAVFAFGFVILLVVAIFIISHKMRQKRIQALQAFAAQNGWTFIPNATPQIFQNANAYSIFNHSRRDLIALLQRPHDGGSVFVFDYSYTVGSGKNSSTYTQTIAAFHTPRLQIPYFALYPESFFSFIGEMFGYNDIDFHTHPVFSNSYKLTGRDEMPIRRIFHPQALSFFEHQQKINVDGGGNYLFIYLHNQTFKPENLNSLLDTALYIYNLFRR
jgi:hypothetical protein